MRVLFLESHPMWIHGLPNGFRDLGHGTKVSGPLTEVSIQKMISQFCPDLIFTIGWTPANDTIQKQALIGKYVRASGVPHIYWATEDPGFTQTFSLPYIERANPDFVFTICPQRVEFYEKMGIPAALLDFGYHSSVHTPVDCCEQYRGTVALVANSYPRLYERKPELFRFTSLRSLIEPLLEDNMRIDFYGYNWEQMRGAFLPRDIPQDWIHSYLPYTEANKVYSSVDIIIGVQNMPTQLTQRTYEILGSAGFLLTVDTPAVRSLFKPGRDLIVSSTKEDTLRLTRYYLENPEERQKIRNQGSIAVQKHSYKHRAEYILEILRKRKILPEYVE